MALRAAPLKVVANLEYRKEIQSSTLLRRQHQPVHVTMLVKIDNKGGEAERRASTTLHSSTLACPSKPGVLLRDVIELDLNATATARAAAEADAPCAAAKSNPDSTESPGVAELQPKPKLNWEHSTPEMKDTMMRRRANNSIPESCIGGLTQELHTHGAMIMSRRGVAGAVSDARRNSIMGMRPVYMSTAVECKIGSRSKTRYIMRRREMRARRKKAQQKTLAESLAKAFELYKLYYESPNIVKDEDEVDNWLANIDTKAPWTRRAIPRGAGGGVVRRLLRRRVRDTGAAARAACGRRRTRRGGRRRRPRRRRRRLARTGRDGVRGGPAGVRPAGVGAGRAQGRGRGGRYEDYEEYDAADESPSRVAEKPPAYCYYRDQSGAPPGSLHSASSGVVPSFLQDRPDPPYPEGDDESCDVKEELHWCQGEVRKILSVAKDNKAASFQVEWDAMADMIGEFTKKTTSDVELKSAKFTKVSDGGWRYDLGLVVLDVDIVEAKPKMKSEQTGVKQKKEEEGEGEIWWMSWGEAPEAPKEKEKKKEEEEERRGGEKRRRKRGDTAKQTLIVGGNEFTPGSSGSGQSAVLSHQ
ncbi:hypothetical protein THAOC_13295 [Thalassiosira oceanica]|uniref:Uncharacterized protein n=1 Tax=Thalassiosira oceanica TaxID=159749 RepID=K0SI13_THAOC|nr:hypothetical protein THAOC_13295 [Thalassiosira oceanica]|eukprot:EJK65808.1 hypothetical protein THAOC_13295 [Thalassiosira oceanica]